MRDRFTKLAGFVLGSLVLVAMILLTSVDFGSQPTDQTLYYIDDNNVYYAPPLLSDDPRTFAYSVFAADAVDHGFEPLDQAIAKSTDYDALVYVNPKTRKWVLKEDSRNHILLSTVTRKELGDIKGRKPDPLHRERRGFYDSCGPYTWLLRKAGFRRQRFASDGSWNW